MTLIRIIAPALGGPDPLSGTWLKSFDPNARNGRGLIVGTTDRNEAHRFEDAGAAMECWRQVSTTHPTRLDGRPNRPLTAYTIDLVRE